MEIREFAQRVLFAGSLEQKLDAGVELTDEDAGPALGTPGAPGRPADLQMQRGDGRAPFPGTQRLVDEEQRGILLHFFANHELLATELMALVLLKFPEAPKAFRRGIVRTLREEQLHTRWYLERMQQCGVKFGDLPLNRFFWDTVAPMETPLDYVTRLSLTFEQANLDYARHYSAILREAGDPQTAAILEQIYRDEIGHVGYGLRWFRRWKSAQQSDWQAYRAQLQFPLSPSRGRGNVPFNAEGRLRAGLGEEFVREMEHFEHSKGRTPNVFWFNPSAEASIAAERAGIRFHPRKEVAALSRDLEVLPAFLARRDDVLLVGAMPPLEERARLRGLGLVLPEFEELSATGELRVDSVLRERKLNDLRPWAWSPQSAALLAPLVKNLPGHSAADDVGRFWNTARGALFSKCWAVARRWELLERVAGLEPASAGRCCETLEAVDAAIHTLREGGRAAAVALKAPFGTSGQKNRRLLADEELAGPARRWVERILREQQALIVEPWLERVFDFSVQYEMGAEGLTKVALIQLHNDSRGQFQACECGPRFGQGLRAEVARFLMGNGKAHAESPLRLYDVALRQTLEAALLRTGYRGPLGIDVFVYRSASGALALQPLVEVNPRYTMGRLTWELMQQVAPGCCVRFELVNAPGARAAGCETLQEYAAWVGQNAAPVLNAQGRLAKGAVVLNCAASATQALAVLSVR